MTRPYPFVLAATFAALIACDSSQRTPSAPPVPDIDLPGTSDVGASAEGAATGGDAGAPVPLDELRSPIADNMLEFVPATLDGVNARRRQAIKTAPIVHGFYEGENKKIYNLHIAGPNETESDRREKYPLLGTDKTESDARMETVGFKIKQFDAVRIYDKKKKKSESIVLVNPFVQLKLSVAPTEKADDSTKLLEEIDLVGLSKLR